MPNIQIGNHGNNNGSKMRQTCFSMHSGELPGKHAEFTQHASPLQCLSTAQTPPIPEPKKTQPSPDSIMHTGAAGAPYNYYS